MKQQKLSADLRLLAAFAGLRNVSDLFFGTFLVSFIMQLSANEIVSVSMYKLFEYAATCAGFFAFAHWCKKYDKTTVFKLNLVPKIILLLLIIGFKNNVAEYVIPLGLLFGIGAAMYHLPMNAMIGEKATPNVMNKFIGVKNTVVYIVKILAPVVLGFFIDTGSYTEMAYAILGLTIVEFILSLFLSPSHHRSRTPVDFVGFFKCMMRFPVIRKMFTMEIMRGFGIGLLGTVITMWTVYMFKTDLNLGIFTTLFAMFSIATSWAFGRWGRKKSYPYVLSLAMLATIVAMTIFLSETNPATFLVYNFVYSTAIILIDLINGVCIYSLSNAKCVTKNHKIEYFVFRDFALFIGRWIGFTGLMYIGVFGGFAALRWYLVLITLSVLGVGAMAGKLSKHIHGR